MNFLNRFDMCGLSDSRLWQRSKEFHWAHDVVATLIQRRNNVVCPVGYHELRDVL